MVQQYKLGELIRETYATSGDNRSILSTEYDYDEVTSPLYSLLDSLRACPADLRALGQRRALSHVGHGESGRYVLVEKHRNSADNVYVCCVSLIMR